MHNIKWLPSMKYGRLIAPNHTRPVAASPSHDEVMSSSYWMAIANHICKAGSHHPYNHLDPNINVLYAGLVIIKQYFIEDIIKNIYSVILYKWKQI